MKLAQSGHTSPPNQILRGSHPMLSKVEQSSTEVARPHLHGGKSSVARDVLILTRMGLQQAVPILAGGRNDGTNRTDRNGRFAKTAFR